MDAPEPEIAEVALAPPEPPNTRQNKKKKAPSTAKQTKKTASTAVRRQTKKAPSTEEENEGTTKEKDDQPPTTTRRKQTKKAPSTEGEQKVGTTTHRQQTKNTAPTAREKSSSAGNGGSVPGVVSARSPKTGVVDELVVASKAGPKLKRPSPSGASTNVRRSPRKQTKMTVPAAKITNKRTADESVLQTATSNKRTKTSDKRTKTEKRTKLVQFDQIPPYTQLSQEAGCVPYGTDLGVGKMSETGNVDQKDLIASLFAQVKKLEERVNAAENPPPNAAVKHAAASMPSRQDFPGKGDSSDDDSDAQDQRLNTTAKHHRAKKAQCNPRWTVEAASSAAQELVLISEDDALSLRKRGQWAIVNGWLESFVTFAAYVLTKESDPPQRLDVRTLSTKDKTKIAAFVKEILAPLTFPVNKSKWKPIRETIRQLKDGKDFWDIFSGKLIGVWVMNQRGTAKPSTKSLPLPAPFRKALDTIGFNWVSQQAKSDKLMEDSEESDDSDRSLNGKDHDEVMEEDEDDRKPAAVDDNEGGHGEEDKWDEEDVQVDDDDESSDDAGVDLLDGGGGDDEELAPRASESENDDVEDHDDYDDDDDAVYHRGKEDPDSEVSDDGDVEEGEEE